MTPISQWLPTHSPEKKAHEPHFEKAIFSYLQISLIHTIQKLIYQIFIISEKEKEHLCINISQQKTGYHLWATAY